MPEVFEQGEFDPAVVGPLPRPLPGEQATEAYGDGDVERYLPEPAKSRTRTPFQRDRARVVHSSAMRRLGAKTQVLTPGTDDFSRTRLTHSLEVAQIGREMGRSLGADPDVVDCACLTHDLGHPPFGHNGEAALAELASDIGGFEGNAQTLRVLTRLEPKVFASNGQPAGLNLTRATLDASVKYPWPRGGGPPNPDGSPTRKFGVYFDDLPVFEWLRRAAPAVRGAEPSEPLRAIEAQIMDLADDIAYSVHDVEDGVVGGRIDPAALGSAREREHIVAATRAWYGSWQDAAELHAALDRLRATGLLDATLAGGRFDGSSAGAARALGQLKDCTSSLIGRFAGAAQQATLSAYGPGPHTRYRAQLVVPPDTAMEILVLKGIAVAYVMAPRGQEPVYRAQREILADLVAVLSDRAPLALEPIFAESWLACASDEARARVVIDQVASLTDISATHWHARLLGQRGWAANEVADGGYQWLG